jgi:hypothetical protein
MSRESSSMPSPACASHRDCPAIIPYHKISSNRLLLLAILTFVLRHVSTASTRPQSRTASAETGGSSG